MKGLTISATRNEFEYEIPHPDAVQMLDTLCERPLIEKTRHKVLHDGLTFEIDEFHGDNAGLVVLEVELESEDQNLVLPGWIGEEVTNDPRYFNSNLSLNPFPSW